MFVVLRILQHLDFVIKAIGGGRRSKKNLLCKTMLKGPNFKGVIPKVDKNYF